MAGAKLGEEALRQIAEMFNAFEKRLLNREVNRFRAPIGGQAQYLGKTSSSVTKGQTPTIPLYSLGASTATNPGKGDEAATGEEIDAYARMGDIAANKWVFVEWIDGGWEVYCIECE